jgi:hypothetical protein
MPLLLRHTNVTIPSRDITISVASKITEISLSLGDFVGRHLGVTIIQSLEDLL